MSAATQSLWPARPDQKPRQRRAGMRERGIMPGTAGRMGGSPPSTVTESLKEMERFFQGKDQVHKTLRRTVQRLEKAGIAYAVVGGMALNAHRYRRATTDVDV